MTSHSHEGEHGHPQPIEYIKIAAILTVITGVEVALYYMESLSFATTAILILSTLKFAVVVMWYMHLKFDSKLFTYFFVGGLLLAGLVLMALQSLLPIIHAAEAL